MTAVCTLAAAVALAVPAFGSAAPQASPGTVKITACRSVVKVRSKGGAGFYYRCVGAFSLGIPASIKRVNFYVDANGGGFVGGRTFGVSILDAASRQPLISPLTLRLGSYANGGFTWHFWLNGPFPKISIVLQPTLDGKPIGVGQIFRFV